MFTLCHERCIQNMISKQLTILSTFSFIFTIGLGLRDITLLGDGKLIMGLKTIVNQLIFGVGIRLNSSLRLLLHLLFFMDVNSGVVVSLVNPRER
jgi:hypothetical protein